MDHWGEGDQPEGQSQRIDGYSAFRYVADDQSRPRLTLWPRRANKNPATGHYSFQADPAYELNAKQAIVFALEGADDRSRESVPPPRDETADLREEWKDRMDPALTKTMEVHRRPYTDEILDIKNGNSAGQIDALAREALARYVRGDNPSLTDCFLIARALRDAIRRDDSTVCKTRPFIYPVHQYLSTGIREEAEAERAAAIATLNRWLEGLMNVYPTARDFAAFELGMCGATGAIDALVDAVKNPFETEAVRTYAALALGMLRATAAVGPLLAVYNTIDSPRLSAAVAHAILFIAQERSAASSTAREPIPQPG
jgi:hypothetical protein